MLTKVLLDQSCGWDQGAFRRLSDPFMAKALELWLASKWRCKTNHKTVKVSGDTTSCRLVNKPERLSCVNRPAVVTLVKAKLPRPGRYNGLDFELHPVLRQVASAFHSSIHEARPTAFRLLKFL
ncbi:hypothetical protein J6590_093126 [Homalodisca vitripennis]|nr:hypothetical protein J6590_093126 [Homalodisca vitripennis]